MMSVPHITTGRLASVILRQSMEKPLWQVTGQNRLIGHVDEIVGAIP